MHTLTLTAADGTKYTGRLPVNWHTVTFTDLALLATATTEADHTQALAQLTGLPTIAFDEDATLYDQLRQHLRWLYEGSLPQDTHPVPQFLHAGVVYEFVGDLQTVAPGQQAALTALLQSGKGEQPLQHAPDLLAVLYKPQGKALTPATVAATAQAFRTLRVSAGWPAIAALVRHGLPIARVIRTYQAVCTPLAQLLDTVEQSMTPADGSWSTRLQHGFLRHWTRQVRQHLPVHA